MSKTVTMPSLFFSLAIESVLLAAPASVSARRAPDLLMPAPGQCVVYEGKAFISQESGASTSTRSELSTTLSYLLFPGRSEDERRMLLVRSLAIRANDIPLPARNEARFFWVGKNLETTLAGDTPEELIGSAYEMHVPSALFPRFELPENGSSSREEEVLLLGRAAAKVPITVTVEEGSSTLKVIRRLAPGKTAAVDLEGSPSTLEAWSETHIFDLERRIVAEVRRELRLLTERGPQKFRTSARNELKAKEVRSLGPGEREHAQAIEREVTSVFDDFRSKKPPRDIYSKIQSISQKEGVKLVEGLPDALLSRFAAYRQGLDQEERDKGSNKEALDFTLEDLEGKQVSFREATRGKVVLLSFWGYG